MIRHPAGCIQVACHDAPPSTNHPLWAQEFAAPEGVLAGPQAGDQLGGARLGGEGGHRVAGSVRLVSQRE